MRNFNTLTVCWTPDFGNGPLGRVSSSKTLLYDDNAIFSPHGSLVAQHWQAHVAKTELNIISWGRVFAPAPPWYRPTGAVDSFVKNSSNWLMATASVASLVDSFPTQHGTRLLLKVDITFRRSVVGRHRFSPSQHVHFFRPARAYHPAVEIRMDALSSLKMKEDII